MVEVTKLLATLCCGVFFGAALYISLVQHPATLETGNDFAARFFPQCMSGPLSFRRASLPSGARLLSRRGSGVQALYG
jgi:hypothetical protein